MKTEKLRSGLAFPFTVVASFFAWLAIVSWMTRNKVRGVNSVE